MQLICDDSFDYFYNFDELQDYFYQNDEFLWSLRTFTRYDWMNGQNFCLHQNPKVQMFERLTKFGICFTLNTQNDLLNFETWVLMFRKQVVGFSRKLCLWYLSCSEPPTTLPWFPIQVTNVTVVKHHLRKALNGTSRYFQNKITNLPQSLWEHNHSQPKRLWLSGTDCRFTVIINRSQTKNHFN